MVVDELNCGAPWQVVREPPCWLTNSWRAAIITPDTLHSTAK